MILRKLTLIAVVALSMIATPTASAHLVTKPTDRSVKAIHKSQTKNLAHARYVCNKGANANKVWHCKAVKWLSRELKETERKLTLDWAAIHIHYATRLATEFPGNHWPNCPDPFDRNPAPWWNPSNPKDKTTTLGCENGGSWLDSPGFYRCGLQFDPMWERHYGRKFCP